MQPAETALPRAAQDRVLELLPYARITDGDFYCLNRAGALKWLSNTNWEEVAQLLGV